MYPNMFFVNFINKTSKYTMLLCIFSRVTEYNTSFYISFAFPRYKDKNLYYWVLTKVKELYS